MIVVRSEDWLLGCKMWTIIAQQLPNALLQLSGSPANDNLDGLFNSHDTQLQSTL